MLRTYCVTHEAPLVPTHLVDSVIGVNAFQRDGSPELPPSRAFWSDMGSYTTVAAGNYEIPFAMRHAAPTELTGIFSHRKFIARNRIGRPSSAFAFSFEVDRAEASRISRAEIEPRPGCDFLVHFPVKFEEGVVTQYINSHRGVDLFDYISLAVELGVLSFNAANAFASAEVLIPGGCELGVYPSAWISSTLEELEKLGREFLTRCVPRLRTYDAAQARAVEFLAERLGSYLLLRELNERYQDDIPQDVYGFFCVVV